MRDNMNRFYGTHNETCGDIVWSEAYQAAYEALKPVYADLGMALTHDWYTNDLLIIAANEIVRSTANTCTHQN